MFYIHIKMKPNVFTAKERLIEHLEDQFYKNFTSYAKKVVSTAS